jgi:hypothetical protein
MTMMAPLLDKNMSTKNIMDSINYPFTYSKEE